nr:hypothetical protein CJLB15_00064 [Campylobacter phage CJLB-15]
MVKNETEKRMRNMIIIRLNVSQRKVRGRSDRTESRR